jgi:hypothetical protein
MSSQETFTVSGAARLTGYSLPTIRKKLPQLKDAGAVNIGGRWAIPLSALHACGLMSNVGESVNTTSKQLQTETISELETLRAENSDLRRRAEVAEAIATERAAALERADRALLALEAARPSARKRWRLFGDSSAV